MGKILTNPQGKAIIASGNAFEVTASVDPNIQQGNIKKDVTILGVTGTYEAPMPNLQTLNVSPATINQRIIPASPVDGFDEVNVAGVTAAIDSNIVAGNIKKDVQILGVTGTYEGSGGNWLIDVLSSYIQTGSHVEITPEQGAELAPVAARVSGFARLFELTNLRTVSLNGVTTIVSGNYAFDTCVEMTSISFPDLVSISAWGFLSNCRALTTLSFPELTTLQTNSLREAFSGCSALTSISFPKLTTGDTETAFWQAFSGCTSLRTIEIHPDSLSNSGAYWNPLVSATMITNLVLSQPATNDVYMTWCANLSTDSILGILNKLDNTVTGKTCAFPTKTIASSDPNYAAISAKVAALTNWTITGLTL